MQDAAGHRQGRQGRAVRHSSAAARRHGIAGARRSHRIDTADVDDIIWGTSSQRGPQSGDLGRMSALDAGYDVRASGVTLDRFCGSGITSVNMAANAIMAGGAGMVVSGASEQ